MVGASGLIAGLLSVMWTGGTVLIASRLPDEYVGLVLLATTGMYAGLPAMAVLAGAAAMTTVSAIVAVTIAVHTTSPRTGPDAGRGSERPAPSAWVSACCWS